MKIKEANEIVILVREFNRNIDKLEIPNDINFLGCSEFYVEEKIDSLVSSLKWLRKRLAQVEDSQSEQKARLKK